MVHDAAARSLRKLAEVAEPTGPNQPMPLHILAAAGVRIVYARPAGSGRWTVHLAEIASPKAGKKRG
jgi:hypothetical protein